MFVGPWWGDHSPEVQKSCGFGDEAVLDPGGSSVDVHVPSARRYSNSVKGLWLGWLRRSLSIDWALPLRL